MPKRFGRKVYIQHLQSIVDIATGKIPTTASEPEGIKVSCEARLKCVAQVAQDMIAEAEKSS